MEIAKITNEEEFLKVTSAYNDLLKDLSTVKASTLKEKRLKIENFTNKHLVKLNNQALKDEAKLTNLLNFLLMIDEHLPDEDFFKNTGLELFPTLFKLTFFEQDYSVVNSTSGTYLDTLNILPHSEIQQMVTKTKHPQAKCNILVNNLLTKMLIYADK